MSKLKSFQLMIIAIVVLILLPFIGKTSNKDVINQKGPDAIPINLPSEPYGNEMPSVNFMHTLHNQAADGKCAECHTQKDDTFIFKFKPFINIMKCFI